MNRSRVPVGPLARLAPLPFLALLACAPGERYREPRSRLERVISYRELQPGSEPRELSKPQDTQPPGATRVPLPASIDVDAAVELHLDRSLLGAGGNDRIATEIAELDGQATTLTKLAEEAVRMSELEQQASAAFVEKESAAVEARDAARAAFRAKRDQLDSAELRIQNGLRAALSENDRDDLDRAMAGRKGYRGAREYLQRRVDEFLARQQTLAARLKDQTTTLELTALLVSPKTSEPTQIHLPGYDNLSDGQWRPYDRTGIHLTDAQRAALEKNWDATVKLSQTLQKILDGDAKTLELLAAIAPNLAAALDSLLADAESIRKSLVEMRAQLPQFVAALKKALPTTAIAQVEKLQKSLELLTQAAELHARGKDLATRWRLVRAEQLASLTSDTWAFFDDLMKIAGVIKSTDWKATVEAVVAEFTDDIADQLRNDPQLAPFFTAATVAFDKLAPALKKAKEFIDELPKPGTAPITPPKGIAVPIDDALDTGFDLTTVAREPGDQVRISAQLHTNGKLVDRAEATFRVEAFGWRGELSPAVVLARPDRLAGVPEHFGFSPSLSWLHSYTPRPDQDGCGARLARALQPGMGIHAAFLNFDPDREVEFGLGFTLAFWRGRLQFGGGYNLMADSRDEGRYYYFVGSDLIGLLQQIGLK